MPRSERHKKWIQAVQERERGEERKEVVVKTGINYVNWDNSDNAMGLSYLRTDEESFFPIKPIKNPPIPRLTKHPELLEEFFNKVKGISIVRLWVGYEHEGLVFDDDCNLVGIDEKYWIPNIVKILDVAHSHGVKMYLCLVELANTGVTNEGDNRKYRKNQIKIMQEYIRNPDLYIDKVITPLVKAVGDHPGLFAIDLINEPENAVESEIDKGKYFSMDEFENFSRKVCEAIHSLNKNVKVSVGCLNRETAMKWSSFLDFADFHSYCDENLVSYGVPIPPYDPKDFHGKECIIGELGYAHEDENEYNEKADRIEVRVNTEYVDRIRKLGYSAALPWGIDSDAGFLQSQKNSDAILHYLIETNKLD